MVIGAGAMGRMHVDLALSYRPRAMVVADLVEARLELVRTLLGPRASKAGIDLQVVNPGTTDLNKLVNHSPIIAGPMM